jgi:hypothetical protein
MEFQTIVKPDSWNFAYRFTILNDRLTLKVNNKYVNHRDELERLLTSMYLYFRQRGLVPKELRCSIHSDKFVIDPVYKFRTGDHHTFAAWLHWLKPVLKAPKFELIVEEAREVQHA